MGALIRGLQNLEVPFGKILILFQRSRHCGELNRGLKNLEKLSKGKFQRPRSDKGVNLVSAKFLSVGAESRFAKHRIIFLEGFNLVSAKPLLRRAESRFAEPRCSLQRERIVTFCVVQKVTKKHAGLRPATSIQISARYDVLS